VPTAGAADDDADDDATPGALLARRAEATVQG